MIGRRAAVEKQAWHQKSLVRNQERESQSRIGPARAYLTITHVRDRRVRFTDMGDEAMTG